VLLNLSISQISIALILVPAGQDFSNDNVPMVTAVNLEVMVDALIPMCPVYTASS
jgi:hypothetical protein